MSYNSIARAVEVILSDAKILDTIVYGIVNIVNVMPGSIKAVGIVYMPVTYQLCNCIRNRSGSSNDASYGTRIRSCWNFTPDSSSCIPAWEMVSLLCASNVIITLWDYLAVYKDSIQQMALNL